MSSTEYPYSFESCFFINSIGEASIRNKPCRLDNRDLEREGSLYNFWSRLISLFPYNAPTIVSDANVKASVFADLGESDKCGKQWAMLEFEFAAMSDSVADVLTLVVQMGEEMKKRFPSLSFHVLTFREDYFSLAIVGLRSELIYTIRAALVTRDLLQVNEILLRNHVGISS